MAAAGQPDWMPTWAAALEAEEISDVVALVAAQLRHLVLENEAGRQTVTHSPLPLGAVDYWHQLIAVKLLRQWPKFADVGRAFDSVGLVVEH